MANVLDKIARFPKIRAGYIREIAPASAGQGLNRATPNFFWQNLKLAI